MHRYTTFLPLSRTRARTRDKQAHSLQMHQLAILLCLFLALLLSGCSASEQPRPSREAENPDLVVWPHADRAIQIQVSADRNLNMFDLRPHSLQLCVYQLENPDSFLDLARSREGINTLLEAKAFDQSVKSVTRMFVQPLEDNTFHLDRADGARYVGIACGYFDASPENCVRLWEIQPNASESGYLFWKSTTYSAGTLSLALHLTANAMVEKDEQNQEQQ
ncbi:MAG: type VI secretion system lipoprotein TssJ [Desulfovibrionaceae bacterium]|nr:type VI secretion system lipoprotein TssJ [Desulfovibrionaceae bacterium]